MNLSVRHLDYIRTKDARLYDAISDIKAGIERMARQLVANPSGEVGAPPTPSSLSVTASNGSFAATIFDNNPVLRGIVYFLEVATGPTFDNPVLIVFLGPSRQWTGFLGSGTYYFRAFSQYPTSAPSLPVYFGSANSPTGVAGGGTLAAPTPTGTGSGTASSNGYQGGAGYGFTTERGGVRLR